VIKSTKVWTVRIGDNLPAIAARTYDDPRQWRLIADANKIDNPLRFPSEEDLGRLLIIPVLRP
jgi:nucleoid-associated protein YgaU